MGERKNPPDYFKRRKRKEKRSDRNIFNSNVWSIYGNVSREIFMECVKIGVGEKKMELYELINMSDKITFYSENDEYARAVTLLLGEGKCGCRKQDGTSLEHCMTAFKGNAPREIYEQIEEMLKKKDEKLIFALKSVAVCDFGEREIFDEYTENGANEEKYKKWDDTHRTSINNYGKYARTIAKAILEQK